MWGLYPPTLTPSWLRAAPGSVLGFPAYKLRNLLKCQKNLSGRKADGWFKGLGLAPDDLHTFLLNVQGTQRICYPVLHMQIFFINKFVSKQGIHHFSQVRSGTQGQSMNKHYWVKLKVVRRQSRGPRHKATAETHHSHHLEIEIPSCYWLRFLSHHFLFPRVTES